MEFGKCFTRMYRRNNSLNHYQFVYAFIYLNSFLFRLAVWVVCVYFVLYKVILVVRSCDFVFLFFYATTITGRKYSNKTYRVCIYFFLNSITGITAGGGRWVRLYERCNSM